MIPKIGPIKKATMSVYFKRSVLKKIFDSFDLPQRFKLPRLLKGNSGE